MEAPFKLSKNAHDEVVYEGPNRNIRTLNPKGHADKFSWISLQTGSVVPDSVFPRLQQELNDYEAKVRVAQLEADLRDDNKRNFSHDVKKTSPGRPKKDKKKNLTPKKKESKPKAKPKAKPKGKKKRSRK